MTRASSAPEARLLNDFQRDFPLVERPFAAIAARLGVTEAWVLETLAHAIDDGRVSRVGAVFRPGSIGVSTLAALVVPERDLDRVAAVVSARPEVNHNYEREHRFNLWFVAAAADPPALDASLAAIAADSGYRPLSLPLLEDYWIDLGFDHSGPTPRFHTRSAARGDAAQQALPLALSDADRRVVAAIEEGLPLVATPFTQIARSADVAPPDVLARLAAWLRAGAIKRFGVVVRHRPLGFAANAMCVWDVPDAAADALGVGLAREAAVTLCYRRRRALPDWRYNLFCMLHGRDRGSVTRRLATLSAAHGLDRFASAVLFSRRAFKQCGARYLSTPAQAPALIAA